MSTDIVTELWNGLGDNGFHVIDSRQWNRHPDSELTVVDRVLIVLTKQIPPKYSKNVRLVKKDQSGAFLYAHQSDDQHFWGVSRSVISELAKPTLPLPWAVVLLDGDWRTGYWFDSATFLTCTRSWRPRKGPQGEDVLYYVGGSVTRCRKDTEEADRFLATGTLLRLLNGLVSLPKHHHQEIMPDEM